MWYMLSQVFNFYDETVILNLWKKKTSTLSSKPSGRWWWNGESSWEPKCSPSSIWLLRAERLELKELGVWCSLCSMPSSPLPSAESSKESDPCFSRLCLWFSADTRHPQNLNTAAFTSRQYRTWLNTQQSLSMPPKTWTWQPSHLDNTGPN